MDIFKGRARSVNVGTSLKVGLLLLVGFLLVFHVSAVVAQEQSESEPTGMLVLVPDDLYVGETTDVLGFHLESPDKAITIGYSEHFVPESEECDSAEAGTAAFTAPPARISLTACTTGEGRVQLMEADTGTVIAEATATISEPESASREARQGCIDPITFGPCLPDAPTGLSALVLGQRDIAVTWDRLDGAEKYKVEREEEGVDDSTETIEVTGTGKSFVVDAGTEHTFRVQAFGNGSTWAAEWGSWSGPVTVTTEAPPTMSVSRGTSPITEGDSAEFTLTGDPAPSFLSLTINIVVSQEGDFLTSSSPPSTVRLRKGSETASLSLSTTDDSIDEDDGSVTVTIRSATGYNTYYIDSSNSSDTVEILDDDIPPVENIPPELTGESSPTYPENGTGPVATYSATDEDGDTITWSLPNTNFETDRHDFSISDIGVLTFDSSPDFEDPDDSNRDNIYKVTVRASDGNGGSDSIDVTVTVTNRRPTITSGTSSPSYAEGGTVSVGIYVATDPGGGDITWSLPNTSFETDRHDFSISDSGVLTFDDSPDYENPDDSNDDNVYKVTVRASDGSLTASRNVTITVTNRRPTITSGTSSPSYAEGGTGSVGTYVASDPGGGDITWSLPNTPFETDRLDFNISSNGVLTFDDSPDYEDPHDSNDDNMYKVTVRTSDGSLIGSIDVTINVTDVNEPPVFSNTATNFDIPENIRAVANKFAEDEDSADSVTYALGGTDKDLFSVDDFGIIAFTNAPNFEQPGCGRDNNSNNCTLTVTAIGGTGSRERRTAQSLTVNVTDVNEPPDKPSAPNVTSNGETSLSVTWSAPTNTGPPINDYDVQYRVVDSGQFNNVTHTGAATQTIISNLAPSTTYQVQVKAKNVEGTSGWSDSGTGSTAAVVPTVTIARHNDQGTSITEGDNVQFTLSADPVPTADLMVTVSIGDSLQGGYLTGDIPKTIEIEMRSRTADIILQTEDDSVDEANGIISAVVKHGTGYRVGSSSLASVTVLDNDLPIPPEPTGISANSTSNDAATVTWSHISGIDAYNVRYRKSGGIGWRSALLYVTSSDSVTVSRTVTGLKCETRYRFRVRAFGDGITYRGTYGPFSRIVYATTGDCDPVTPTPTPTPTPIPPDVEYAPLVPSPGPAILCREISIPLPGLGPIVPRKRHAGPRMVSEDGRHEAQAELYSTRQWYDQNKYCIEARFISESTPGADRIEWSGKIYKTERVPNLEGLSPSNIPALIASYEDQPPTDEISYFRKIPADPCETCRGGTIQTEGDMLFTRALKIPTIYARGEHTFSVEGSTITLMTDAQWTMLRQVFVDCLGLNPTPSAQIACLEQEANTIEDELSEDIDTGLLGDLFDLASKIYEFFNPS